MVRQALRLRVVVEAIALWLLAAFGSAAETAPAAPAARTALDLFHLAEPIAGTRALLMVLPRLRHRLYVEMDGARTQAEAWLHTAGFSLLEQRDGEGRRSYQVMSGVLAEQWPALRLHVRAGGPQLSAGLSPRREIPALGFSIPGERYTFEFEGLKDRRLGTALMPRIAWSDAGRHAQYGIAVPIAFRGAPSIGLLLQLRVTFGK